VFPGRLEGTRCWHGTDYGFVAGTEGADGGAAGCAGAARGPDLPGLLGPGPGCRGVLDPLRQPGETGREAKIITVAKGDPNCAEVQNLEQLPEHLLHELENFFDV
jgi:inorganic pyrophosphatase